MNARGMLDQLLSMGQQAMGQGNPPGGSSGKGPGLGTGLLAGGALGALLGNKKLRKMGGGVVAYGGVAALGALAYKVFNDYQARQAGAAPAPVGTPAPAPLSFERLPAPVVETHAQAMLKALIAAAKADGHIDDRERVLIQEKFAPLADDLALRRWVDTELTRPLDPADVAAAATTPEMAAELYLVSVLAVDEQSFMERAYLDELARKLALPDGLKTELETRALSV